MIEMIIEGQSMVLPEDFSLDMVYENPYFTKSSTFSLDVELPVKDVPENIAVFGHCYRLEFGRLKDSYNAEVRINGLVVFAGTAEPQGVTQSGVKLQLLSGNSDKEFFSDNVYIDRLDYGECFIPNNNSAKEFSVFAQYRTEENAEFPLMSEYYNTVDKVEALFLPFSIKSREESGMMPGLAIGNALLLGASHKDRIALTGVVPDDVLIPNKDTPVVRAVQPYLMTIIKKMIGKLGYDLRKNELDDSYMRNLFICNYRPSIALADALPHWTVTEFFKELEKFCSCVVIADSREKVVDILSMDSFYRNENKALRIEDEDILEEFEQEYSEDTDESDAQTGNVGYALNTGDGYIQVDAEILEYAIRKEFNNYDELWKYATSVSPLDLRNKVMIDNAEHRYYILYSTEHGARQLDEFGQFLAEYGPEKTQYYLRQVNLYGDRIMNKDSNSKTELKIVPAIMKSVNVGYWSYWELAFSRKEYHPFYIYMPVTESVPDIKRMGIRSVQEAIEGKDGAMPDKEESSSIEVAFFDGRLRTVKLYNGDTFVYPLIFTDYRQSIAVNANEPYPEWSLSLSPVSSQSVGSTQTAGRNIDTRHPYTIRFLTDRTYDPTQIFLIRNQKYACQSISISYDNTHDSFVAEGVFFRMN